jgi:cell division protein FtsB
MDSSYLTVGERQLERSHGGVIKRRRHGFSTNINSLVDGIANRSRIALHVAIENEYLYRIESILPS